MKTLKELNVKPGDVVQYNGGKMYTVMKDECLKHSDGSVRPYGDWGWSPYFTVVSRAEDTPTKWGDMTPEQKGALLLAHHEGKTIECYCFREGQFTTTHEPYLFDGVAYRIKPEPKVEVVHLMNFHEKAKGHAIVFTVVDGVPDCNSVKMEAI